MVDNQIAKISEPELSEKDESQEDLDMDETDEDVRVNSLQN